MRTSQLEEQLAASIQQTAELKAKVYTIDLDKLLEIFKSKNVAAVACVVPMAFDSSAFLDLPPTCTFCRLSLTHAQLPSNGVSPTCTNASQRVANVS